MSAEDDRGPACPEEGRMRRLIADPSADPEQWAGHVAHCPSCRRIADEALEDAGLGEALRGGAAAEVAREAALLAPEVPGYRITGELGSGGQGVVYRAEQRSAGGRAVALKVIDPGSSPAGRRRMERECRILSQLELPGVVRLYDGGEAMGRLWISMELVNGEHLDRWFESVPLRRRVQAMAQIARSVHAVHGQGIVHRDLKPSNVLVRPDGSAVVLDFGLGRPAEGEGTDDWRFTATGGFAGTVAFAAPEQLCARSDERCDVYSLGVLTYLAAVGEHPFSDVDGFMPLLDAIRAGSFEPPARRSPEVDRGLDAIITRAMGTDPARRYPSAEALATDLETWAAGGLTEAERGRTAAALGRVLRRTWAPAALALGLLGAGSVAVAWGVDMAREARVGRTSTRVLEAVMGARELAERFDTLAPIGPELPERADAWLDAAASARDRGRGLLNSAGPRAEELAAALAELEVLAPRARWRRGRARDLLAARLADWTPVLRAMGRRDVYSLSTLPPCAGLVPLGRNRRTGLFEAWHVATGERPGPGDEGTPSAAPRPADGMVFVLVPAAMFIVDGRRPLRTPARWVAKHPMTVAQWNRLAGRGGAVAPGEALLPVTGVSAGEAGRRLALAGLSAPLELEVYELRARRTRSRDGRVSVELAARGAAARPIDQLRPSTLGLVGIEREEQTLVRSRGQGGGFDFRYVPELGEGEPAGAAAWVRPVLEPGGEGPRWRALLVPR